jgi:phosphomannomutase
MSTPENPRIIALFDVDGTLTIPRGEVTESMMTFLKDLSKKVTVGIVGGSDLPKQEEQLGAGIVNLFPYNFSQNGLVAYKNGELIEIQTIAKHLGEDNVKRIVNCTSKRKRRGRRLHWFNLTLYLFFSFHRGHEIPR